VSISATTGVAGRYASALFELADNARALDQVAQDLDTFKKLLAESTELSRLIASPVIGRDLQGKAVQKAKFYENNLQWMDAPADTVFGELLDYACEQAPASLPAEPPG